MAIKILFLSHRFHPYLGGIEVNSEILALAFHNAGHRVRLVTWTEQVGEKEFPFAVIRKPGIARLIREHNDTDMVFENNPCLRLAWPAVLFGKPSVVALRTWISRFNGQIAWQDKIKYIWLKRITAIIAVSEEVKIECRMPATVIGNPYRADLFKILPDIKRDRDFVFLGRLVSDKGADMAVRAFAKLLKNNNLQKGNGQLSFTIIGDGPELEALKALAAELKIGDYVVFTGALRGTDLVECLNKHRFILVPSLWREPFGNVALEGMACGCLPIVSDGGGLPDAIGMAGLTFKRGDDGDLLLNMQKVLYDQKFETSLRQYAPAHLAAHQPDVVAEKYLGVIKNAVANHKK